MAPPKKFKGGTVMYSYRADAQRWAKISEIAHLRGESLAEVFDRLTTEYYEANAHLLTGDGNNTHE
jgi:hypothetical protein